MAGFFFFTLRQRLGKCPLSRHLKQKILDRQIFRSFPCLSLRTLPCNVPFPGIGNKRHYHRGQLSVFPSFTFYHSPFTMCGFLFFSSCHSDLSKPVSHSRSFEKYFQLSCLFSIITIEKHFHIFTNLYFL